MITVKRVFEKAYGQIPDGATCHIGYRAEYEGIFHNPTWRHSGTTSAWHRQISWLESTDDPIGPDICDEPADTKLFRSIFGDEYEDALDALIAESKHPLDDMKFSEATPEQFKEFWSAKGLTLYIGEYATKALKWLWLEISRKGILFVLDDKVHIPVKTATTFGEAAEAIAALENALGRFGE